MNKWGFRINVKGGKLWKSPLENGDNLKKTNFSTKRHQFSTANPWRENKLDTTYWQLGGMTRWSNQHAKSDKIKLIEPRYKNNAKFLHIIYKRRDEILKHRILFNL